MKRILMIVMVLSLCLTFFACDNGEQKNEYEPLPSQAQKGQFSFSYEIDKTECKAGDKININGVVTNTSAQEYVYTGTYNDFAPEVSLYYISQDNGERVYIAPDHRVVTDDGVQEHIVKNGENGVMGFGFTIPADAPAGKYGITLSFRGLSQDFADVLTVVE